MGSSRRALEADSMQQPNCALKIDSNNTQVDKTARNKVEQQTTFLFTVLVGQKTLILKRTSKR